MICEQQKIGGIRILMSFICDACSRDLVKTDVEDQKYTYYVKQMRKIFYTSPKKTYMN
ncbi:sigma factor G inhibitor Gin [Paenibacillus aestuarii]|nr:sigma factor G inhibitor Gin [Paenibacillus aestuarii]